MGSAFGALIVLMLISVAVSLFRFSSIGELNGRIIREDLVSTNAAHSIDEAAREDARRTLALFILDKSERAKSYDRIDLNKKEIDTSPDTLNKLAHNERDKALISDSVEKVDAGTRLVDTAGKAMDEIVTSVKHVSDIMSEITAASQDEWEEF